MLSSDDQVVVETINMLYVNGVHADAFAMAKQEIDKSATDSSENGILLTFRLAGLLIDIGSAGGIKDAIEIGVSTIVSQKEKAKEYFSLCSIEYNIGSGQHAMFELQRKQGLELKPESVSPLIEAKNSLWRALNNSEGTDNGFKSMLFVNLAYCLNTCGRIAEALQYYDLALRLSPTLPEALASRAQALTFLSELAFGHSINMVMQIRDNYQLAIECSSETPSHIVDRWIEWRNILNAKLDGHDVTSELHETEKESLTHSPYWTYCLTNHLTLCEHALYCNCLGARRDDLTIPSTSTHISGDFIPAMEQTLNRLKYEYHVARLMYYQGLDNAISWDVNAFDANITTSFLADKSVESTSIELLRTSYRTCFSILDKIASAICRMYKLAEPAEHIYFDTFWRKTRNSQRWEDINKIDNLSLLALYTQATDLNNEHGEWGVFKKWRDQLEHGLFVIIDPSLELSEDRAIVLSDDATMYIPLEVFQERLLHLLHFVRSAVFNFTFCIRYEGIKDLRKRGDAKGILYTLKHK